VRAYRLASQTFEYPLHLGITESGTLFGGTIKSSAGLGILLADGIGDTLRVSLAADPVEEVKVGIQMLKALGLRKGGLTFVACPTCGRCSVNMIPIAERVEKKLHVVQGDVHVAVMGCEVNGPGEGREADVGIAFGHAGYGLVFRKGKIVKRAKVDELEGILIDQAQRIAAGEDLDVGGEAPAETGAPKPVTVAVIDAQLHPMAAEVLGNTQF
jgi:(E)-4-hydroxy-3-methylbut-2-enyl-diphosphate synthase